MTDTAPDTKQLIERAKANLRLVPSFWQRHNDWTADRTDDRPFEVCRYGDEDEDEDEIVVVHACATQAEADEKQLDAILDARARAVLSALQQPDERDEVIARLTQALKDIAHAVRLGSPTDLDSWHSLANACQRSARTALGLGDG